MKIKKTLHADIRQYRGVFFNIGLIVAICAALVAFEWKTYDDYDTISKRMVVDVLPDDVPITRINPPPPPPPPKPIQIIEVKEDDPIMEEPPKIDNEPTSTTPIIVEVDDPPIETAPEIFVPVEHMPTYKGGISAFYQFIARKIKYPSTARKLGIEGRVYISFTVNKEGEITNLKVIRGIGGGCDEEALRVLQKSPKWIPGKQRGKPVNVTMTLPITFKLD